MVRQSRVRYKALELLLIVVLLASCGPEPTPSIQSLVPSESKVGVHVVTGPRTGFGTFLRRIADAGKYIRVAKAVDDFSPLALVKVYMPKTLTVGRINSAIDYETGIRYDLQAFKPSDWPTPEAAAQFYWHLVSSFWTYHSAYVDVWETFNEFSSDWAWQGQFYIEMMRLAEGHPFKLSLYNFSTGNPPESVYPELVASLQYAKAHGHYLSAHQYGGVGTDVLTLRGTEPHHALRHRDLYRYLSQFNADPPLIISEAGQEAGGTFIGTTLFIEDYAWYDLELAQDPYVVGVAAWTLGNWAGANFQEALPELADYIIEFAVPATPTPTLTPTPSVTPTPTRTPTPGPSPTPSKLHLPVIEKEG